MSRQAVALTYQLLGPVRVFDDRAELNAGPAKQRAVLAMLLAAEGRPLSRREIVDGVWGCAAPATAPHLVATYVARLRKAVDPGRAHGTGPSVLLSHGDGYALPTPPEHLDIALFQRARQAARSRHGAGDLAGCTAELERALAFWRGGALEGVPGPHAERLRGRLEEARLSTREQRFAVLLERGRHHETLPELSALAAAHPCRERLRALLMLALYRADRRAEALAAFQDTWRTLVEEDGIEPGAELRTLRRRILDDDPALRPAAAAAPPRRLPAVSRLPPDTPDFTGRRHELAALSRLAARPGAKAAGGRIVAAVAAPAVAVLTGPSGIGKTALAVHAARRLAHRYPDGRLHVHLRGSSDRPAAPGDVLAGLLEDLGVPRGRIPADTERRTALYRTTTAGRRLLLVLDDAADARQVEPLLPASADCLVLVTGRSRPDGADARTVLRLDALDRGEARELLRQVVGAERVDGETVSVDGILDRCAGHPLALRVAAAGAWPVATTPPTAGRLRDAACRSGEPLADGPAVAVLRAGYEGLADAGAAAAFRLLSELAVPDFGAATAAAALDLPENVAEARLEALADAHLLEVSRPPDGAHRRFRYHDLLRVLGRSLTGPDERQAELTAMLGRLTRAHLADVRAAGPLLRPADGAGDDQGPNTGLGVGFDGAEEAVHRLAAERETVVGAALQAAALGAVPAAALAELTGRFGVFLRRRGHWQDWEELALAGVRLARDGTAPDLAAEAAGRLELGTLAAARRRHDEATRELLASISLFGLGGDTAGQARAYSGLGLVYLERGLHGPATACLARALAVHRAAGRPVDAATALDRLAVLHVRRGDLESAERCCTESMAIHAANGTTESGSAAVNVLGLVRGRQRRHAEAVACQRRSRELARARGDLHREARALLDLAAEHRAAGERGEAVACAEEGLALRRRLGDPQGAAAAWTELAVALEAAGHPDRATVCRRNAAAELAGHEPAEHEPAGSAPPDEPRAGL
ncbi:DNA-binding SARP family transcriptional activator [Streptomyces sp. TLI_235]|nr:AfsR/SARP family transcriptional regulator [Streptomyces sp. TLI_235]PBC76526.1 DNA-binding SARP family transcriptional activator [Streptomyces sp. TLI_235]